MHLPEIVQIKILSEEFGVAMGLVALWLWVPLLDRTSFMRKVAPSPEISWPSTVSVRCTGTTDISTLSNLSVLQGTFIISEHLNHNYQPNPDFGMGPVQFARLVAGIAIAIAVAIVFQLFILRNPARKTLRKQLGR